MATARTVRSLTSATSWATIESLTPLLAPCFTCQRAGYVSVASNSRVASLSGDRGSHVPVEASSAWTFDALLRIEHGPGMFYVQHRSAKAGAVKQSVSRKLAGKMRGLPEAMRAMTAKMERGVKRSGAVLSPEILLGYWDPLLDDSPWTYMGYLPWLLERREGGYCSDMTDVPAPAPAPVRNWQLAFQEATRNQGISAMVQPQLGQPKEAMLAAFRQMYVDINRAAAEGSVDPDVCTGLVCDAVRSEHRARMQRGVTMLRWELQEALAPGSARVLQHRMLQGGPPPAPQSSFYQVTVQFRTSEVEKGFDRHGKLVEGRNEPLRRSRVWVFERELTNNAADARWRVCARLGERGDRRSRGAEVDPQEPAGEMKERMAVMWEAQKLALKSEGGMKGYICRALFPP